MRLETTEAIPQLFEAQKSHRFVQSQTTAAERIAKLRVLRAEIIRRREDIEKAIQADFGKHPSETELTEIQPVLFEIRHTIRHLKKWMRPKCVHTPITLFGSHSRLRYEAQGNVLVLAPWNYPFNLTLTPVVAALSAGNTVLLRPSEKVPNTAKVVEEILESCFEPKEVTVIRGGVEVADALLTLPFDHFFFTGSTSVGKKVMASAAQHLAAVTLELGGKSPTIIDETANISKATEHSLGQHKSDRR